MRLQTEGVLMRWRLRSSDFPRSRPRRGGRARPGRRRRRQRHAFAVNVCAACHAVDRAISARPIRYCPTFKMFAERARDDRHGALRVPAESASRHARPDPYAEDLRNVVAYILTFKKGVSRHDHGFRTVLNI